MAMTFNSVDLFCGAGGLTEGFRTAGFTPLYANDHEQPALDTYSHNHPSAVICSKDIRKADPHAIRERLGLRRGDLDVLLGGPPCQGFSTYGKRDPDDHRNQLYNCFLDFLREFRPTAFVMENVVGILSMEGGRIIEDVQAQACAANYGVQVLVLDACHFGVPQFRKRVFVVGGTDNAKVAVPEATHLYSKTRRGQAVDSYDLFGSHAADPQPALTVRDALSDLPKDALPPKQTHKAIEYPTSAGLTAYQHAMRNGAQMLTHHSAKRMLGIRRLRLALLQPGDYGTIIRERLARDGLPDDMIDDLLSDRHGTSQIKCRRQDRKKEDELWEMLHRGHTDAESILRWLDSGGFANKYRRLKWDEPSHTLVAHMARDCSDFVHPEEERFISVREAARLQSFRDTYCFRGSQFMQFRHIGNAVPPLLASAVAQNVARFLGKRIHLAAS